MSVDVVDFGNNTGIKVDENKIRSHLKAIGKEFINKGYIVEINISVVGTVEDFKKYMSDVAGQKFA